MLTLLVIFATFTPEHGPSMLRSFWVLAVCEMAVEAGVVRWLGRLR